MEVEDVKKEVERVIEEIQEFTAYSPKGEARSIDYLYTARKVANCYDEIIASNKTEETIRKVKLLRHHLKSNPQYLDFHEE